MTDLTAPIKHEDTIGDLLMHLGDTHRLMAEHGLEPALAHLIELRASQINQCGYCVKMHTREARQDGETDKRMDRLIVWRHVPDFSAKEKAAFAWVEALTTLEPGTDYAALRGDLREHYSDKEISVITTAVAMINLWNRIQISKH